MWTQKNDYAPPVIDCKSGQVWEVTNLSAQQEEQYSWCTVCDVYTWETLHAVGRPTAALTGIKKTCCDPDITLRYSQSVNNTQRSAPNKLWWPSYARERECVFAFLCSVCALGSDACLMLSESPFFFFFLVAWGQSYVDLVVAKALLHLVEQAAVCQLTEGRQVIIGSWRHQLDLRKTQGEG